MPPQIGGELLDVAPERSRVPDQVPRGQRALVVKQYVVHLPERTLARGRLGALGRELGVRMHVVQRQMPPYVPQVAEITQQLAHRALRKPAVRALEVPVLDEGDLRLLRPADVIPAGVHRHYQVD